MFQILHKLRVFFVTMRQKVIGKAAGWSAAEHCSRAEDADPGVRWKGKMFPAHAAFSGAFQGKKSEWSNHAPGKPGSHRRPSPISSRAWAQLWGNPGASGSLLWSIGQMLSTAEFVVGGRDVPG